MGALEARGRELRREQIVRAQRDEPVGLDPPAALQHLLHRRLQVVEPDLREHAAEPLERLRRAAPGTPAGSRPATPDRTPPRRTTRASRTDAPSPRTPPSTTSRLAPVDLRLHARARGPAARTPPRPASPSRACARARTARTVVSATSAPCSSTSRCQIRFAVCRCLRGASRSASSHPSITARYGPNFGAGRPTGDRFTGGTGDSQRLPHRPPMHPMTHRQRPDRQALPIPVPS